MKCEISGRTWVRSVPGLGAVTVGLVISLLGPWWGQAEPPLPDKVSTAFEALSRLKGVDLEANPAVKNAVKRVLEEVRGRQEFVDLVRDFNLAGEGRGLLELALTHTNHSTRGEAMRLLLADEAVALVPVALASTNGVAAVNALGFSGDKRALPLLLPLVTNTTPDIALRKSAIQALVQTQDGTRELLQLARDQRLPNDLQFTAALELSGARSPAIREEARKVLPLPAAQNDQPLPPLRELVRRTGDPHRGAKIFRRETVACNKCHVVAGAGTDFGPNLSEVGTKLAREALYEAILDPNAGISFGYEQYRIELRNGDEVFGLIASETADELAVKTQNGVVTKYPKMDISRKEAQKVSAMPGGLQLAMTADELVDLVEYLASLKKN